MPPMIDPIFTSVEMSVLRPAEGELLVRLCKVASVFTFPMSFVPMVLMLERFVPIVGNVGLFFGTKVKTYVD